MFITRDYAKECKDSSGTEQKCCYSQISKQMSKHTVNQNTLQLQWHQKSGNQIHCRPTLFSLANKHAGGRPSSTSEYALSTL